MVTHVRDVHDEADVGLVRLRRGIADDHLELDEPCELAANEFASGVPTVSTPELRTGGLHDGKASAGPWVLLEAVHCV